MKARYPVTISSGGASATFDALLKTTESYSSTVPAYPTELGFDVSDTIIMDSPVLSMTLLLAKTPVTWRHRNGSNRVEHHAAMLRNLYFQKAPCTIMTSDRCYSSMAIESLSIAKSEDLGYDKQVDITFKKIIVTASQTVTIPSYYGKSGPSEEQQGDASVDQTKGGTGAGAGTGTGAGSEKGSGGSKSSLLYAAANGLGLLGG